MVALLLFADHVLHAVFWKCRGIVAVDDNKTSASQHTFPSSEGKGIGKMFIWVF